MSSLCTIWVVVSEHDEVMHEHVETFLTNEILIKSTVLSSMAKYVLGKVACPT